METVNADDKCHTCGNTFTWHLENNPVHPFNNGQASAAKFLGPRRGERGRDGANVPQRGSEPPRWPLDPVLRVALINKGVITPEDLRDAEALIKATTVDFETTIRESRGHGQ